MTKETNIQLFEEKKVRTIWDDETEECFFSVVDVIEVLTDSIQNAQLLYPKHYVARKVQNNPKNICSYYI
jgi:hypothetical protein